MLVTVAKIMSVFNFIHKHTHTDTLINEGMLNLKDSKDKKVLAYNSVALLL